MTSKRKTGRKITKGTKEWADYNVNCIKGCGNDCRYCYAKMMGKRFGRCTEETWKDMEIRQDVLNKKFRKFNGRVMFPSSHDIYDSPEVKEACYKVIGNLLEADNELLITTKPSLNVVRDIIEKYKEKKNNIQFRFTITSKDNAQLSFWERNAPLYEERKEALILAYKEGFKTSVSVEPFLDERPQDLISEIEPYITESIWVGPMNYVPRKGISNEEEPYYEKIRSISDKTNLKKIYDDLVNMPKIRFKDSHTNRLGIT
ncbi:MAG: radical SAM protein [Candidatus Bathyarchaeota archaeon]|nr:radical SAM protein [Candidatus Bathyarchaeota archaeon]